MLAAPAAVQAQLEAGPFLAYHDDLEAIGVGGYIAIPIPQLAPGFAIIPDIAIFFPDDPLGYLEINGDLAYFFPVSADSPVVPFAFGGLNWARSSYDYGGSIGSESDSDIGLNLGGGVQFAAGALSPFAGAKFEIHDNTAFVIFGGIGFSLGGGM
jgi:hypothetical protein